MNANGKNELVLAEVLGRMERRMRLANYADSTVVSYCRSARLLGSKLGKSPEGIEEEELHEYLLSIKDRMSQSSWHTHLYGVKYLYTEVLDQSEKKGRISARVGYTFPAFLPNISSIWPLFALSSLAL